MPEQQGQSTTNETEAAAGQNDQMTLQQQQLVGNDTCGDSAGSLCLGYKIIT